MKAHEAIQRIVKLGITVEWTTVASYQPEPPSDGRSRTKEDLVDHYVAEIVARGTLQVPETVEVREIQRSALSIAHHQVHKHLKLLRCFKQTHETDLGSQAGPLTDNSDSASGNVRPNPASPCVALIGHTSNEADPKIAIVNDLSVAFVTGKVAPKVPADEVIEKLQAALLIPHGVCRFLCVYVFENAEAQM